MARATKLRVVGGKTQVYVTPRPVKHALEVGSPCPNCGTTLAGPWCYACGQKGEEFHRSIWHLIAEAFEGLTHFDGRVWTTLPKLLLKPGQLTRDYLDGHRASQIPPFRLFLVMLLVVFFTGSLNFETNHVAFKVQPVSVAEVAHESGANVGRELDAWRTSAVGRWMNTRGEEARRHPEALVNAMERWAHQFAILMLPIAALMLTVLFAFKKGVYVFDHLIFSMHSLAFQGFLLSGVLLVGLSGVVGPCAPLLLVASPVHLFVHMRRAYRIGPIGTLVRMAILFAGSLVAYAVLMAGLVFAGLATLK